MQKLMFLTLLSFLISVPSAFGFPAGFISNSGPSNGGGNNSSDGSGGTFHPLNRSARFKICEEVLQKKWSEMGGASYFDNLGGAQSPFYTQLVAKVNEDTSSSGAEGKKTALKNAFRSAMLCNAYFVSTEKSNYDENLEDFTGDGEDGHSSALGAQGLECMGQPTPQAQQQCIMQQQGQGELKCTHNGPETHDYLACKRIVNFIDGFAIGKQVMQVQQTYRAGAAQLDAQSDYARKARSEEGVSIVDGMEIQRDSLEQQANLAYEMMAFDGAKAGVLMGMIGSFPNPEKMIDSCKQQFQDPVGFAGGFLQAVRAAAGESADFIPSPEELANLDVDTICNEAISTNPQFGGENFLFENQEVVDIMKGIAMKAGLEALANGAKGALLNKQADLVEDAMEDIEEFEPPEFPVAEAPEATTSECLVDPEAEGCIAPNGVAFEGFRDSGFNATVGGSANLGSNTNGANFDDDETSGSGAGNTDRSLIPNEFGVVEQAGDFSNEFADGVAQAGSIKTGSGAAGGGGAGAGGGGGGGGLGAAGGGRAPAGKKKPSGPRDIKIKTKGDGLSTVGGRGRIGAAKKKKAANPFSKLLGKNTKKGNQTLNFRGPAQLGGKKGSIFQMISNRYNVVQSKDRLLKYKAEKPQ